MGSMGISTGLKALLAAQYSLDTVGNNLANSNTPGYSRQRVDLAQSLSISRRGLLMGTGVDALQINRAVDEVIERRLLSQRGIQGRLLQRWENGRELELVFGELEGVGISAALDDFFSSTSALSVDPTDAILRTGFVQDASSLASRFNEISSSLTDLGGSSESQAKALVAQVNGLTGQIADLNVQIAKLEPAGNQANGLRDQRQVLMGELAEIVEVQTVEDDLGQYRVYVEGNLLVGGDRALKLDLERNSDGQLEARLEGASKALKVSGGRLSAVLNSDASSTDGLNSELDELAKAFIFEANQVHSTGISPSGGFSLLRASNPLVDSDGSGLVGDERLIEAGLPFDLTEGSLRINMVDETTGAVVSHEIKIDPEQTTVEDFQTALDGIPGLSSTIDEDGYLTLQADAGQRFDFSNRIDANPDKAGTFGGGQASLGGELDGPFALLDGQTLDFAVPAGGATNVSVAFSSADFENLSAATAEEVAAALNADAGFSAAGLTAVDVDGHLHVQTAGSGSPQSFEVAGGSASTGLGFSGLIGQAAQGSDLNGGVELSGSYTGDGDAQFTFVPSGDGTVGTTPDLQVLVYDEQGGLVATLDVGEGYQPGTKLDVVDGIEASFSLAELSATDNDRFTVDATSDSDSSDVLVALGLNGLYTGSDAASMAVDERLLEDPDQLAFSYSGASGDNAGLLAMLDVQDRGADLLEGVSIGDRYGEMISGLGFEVAGLEGSLDSSNTVLTALQARRDSVSAVNVDEELVDMVRFQQAYAAASQYLSIVSRLEDDLLRIL